MAKAINLGELAIAIALKTGALEQGLNEVKKQLQKNQTDVENTGKGYDKLAVVAGLAFYKISQAISSGVKAFNDYNSSMTGLKSVVQGTGQDFTKAQGFIDSFTKDGLVPANEAATSLKNLLSRGFGMNEAEDILNRFKDSAAFSRQASLSMGEAIRGATEGLKNENSVLVDNAGVTKNVSQMWKEYAASIGKGADSLTIEEKRMAEYLGIMKETRFQVGDAAKYSEQFAGAQAKNAAETLKLKQAFGAALVPVLNTLLNIITPLIHALTGFINNNKELAAVLAITAAAFVGLITAVTAFKTAVLLLGPALKALQAGFIALATNPIALILTAIASTAALVAVQIGKARKEQEEYNKAVEEFNKIKQDGIQKSEIPKIQEEINNLQSLVDQYEKLKVKYDEYNKDRVQHSTEHYAMKDAATDIGVDLDKLTDGFRKAGIQIDLYTGSTEAAKEKIKALKDAITAANRETLDYYNDQAKTIAQKHADEDAILALIKAYKSAKVGSDEWKKAQNELAQKFPQFSTESGIVVDAIERVTKAQNDQVDQEWKALQSKIEIGKKAAQLSISQKEATLSAIYANMALLGIETQASAAGVVLLQGYLKQVEDIKKSIAKEKDEMKSLDDLKNTPLDKIKGVQPLDIDTSSVKAYENKELDSALKVHDYKVRMSQMSKAQEIADLQAIEQKYAKTADERMDLDERIFAAREALRQADIKADDDYIKRRTQNSMNWIEDQKLRDPNFSANDEIAAYDRIIAYHKEYIKKIISDDKLTADEKKQILQDEYDAVREYENKKYSIRKEYLEQQKQDEINSINNLDQGLESALRKKYEQEQKIQDDALQNELDNLEKWQDASIKMINSVYDAKIKAIDDAAKVQENAIQAEIDALDEAAKAKDRNETDAAELLKINSLQDQIAYEHDAYNKVQLQKELDNLLAERQKRLEAQQLEDKKDALGKQLDAVKDNSEQQKQELENQKQAELDKIQAVYDAEKLSIQNRQAAWQAYYAQRLSDANIQAEAEKLIVDNNQKDILALLKGYGSEYQIAGQTLGEKLVAGFKTQVDSIRGMIASITAEINAARDAAISASVQASTSTASGVKTLSGDNVTNKTTNITQNLTFTSTAMTPSETARKNLQASRELASEVG